MLRSADATEQIIGAAIEVHKELGPGLLEAVYEEALCYEFGLRGIEYERQLELPVNYKGHQLSAGCRIDVLVAGSIVVELKAVESILPVHEAQLMTYLRMAGRRVGLLINFNVPKLKDGVVRRVL